LIEESKKGGTSQRGNRLNLVENGDLGGRLLGKKKEIARGKGEGKIFS